MTKINPDELVRLKRDLPEIGLHRGDLGVVCSRWFDPNTAFEVEFQPHSSSFPVRALLMPDQIEKSGHA
jgi:hypothetical protein